MKRLAARGAVEHDTGGVAFPGAVIGGKIGQHRHRPGLSDFEARQLGCPQIENVSGSDQGLRLRTAASAAIAQQALRRRPDAVGRLARSASWLLRRRRPTLQ